MDNSVGGVDTGGSWNLMLNISAVNRVNSLAALDSLGVGHDNRLLVADLLNLILTDSGVQNRGDNGGNNRVAVVAKQLGISISLSLHLLSSFLTTSSLNNLGCADLVGDVSADLLELNLLDGDLNVFTLVVNLGCALLESDSLLYGGAVGSMIYEGSYSSVGVEGVSICFGVSFTLDDGSIGDGEGSDHTNKNLHRGDLNAVVVTRKKPCNKLSRTLR